MVGSKQKEQTWIADIQAGGERREKAIPKLYKAYKEPCLKFFRSKSKKGELFEDIYQQTMLAVFRNKLSSVKKPSALKSYVIGIFKNKLYDSLRKLGNETDNTSLDELSDKNMHIGNSEEQKEPDDPILKAQKRKIKSLLWESVGHPCDKILQLRTDGYTNQEIADEIGLKLQTIKNNVKKCREKAKNFFKDHPDYLKLLSNH